MIRLPVSDGNSTLTWRASSDLLPPCVERMDKSNVHIFVNVAIGVAEPLIVRHTFITKAV